LKIQPLHRGSEAVIADQSLYRYHLNNHTSASFHEKSSNILGDFPSHESIEPMKLRLSDPVPWSWECLHDKISKFLKQPQTFQVF